MNDGRKEPVFRTFIDVRRHVMEDVRLAFEDARERRTGERIDRVALVTDDDALGASLAVDTAERREARTAKRRAGDAVAAAFEDEWNPGAWDGIYDEASPRVRFPRIKARDEFRGMMAFQANWEATHGTRTMPFRRRMLRQFADALAELDNEGLFAEGPCRDAIVLFIEMTDSNFGPACVAESVRRLNPIAARRRFRESLTARDRAALAFYAAIVRTRNLGRPLIGPEAE